MNIKSYIIKNPNNNFKQISTYFSENYPNVIHLYLRGRWYKVYNEDAKIISKVMNYKLFYNLYKEECCGFPDYAINKVQKYLESKQISFNIINISGNSYELHDFEEENKYNIYKSKAKETSTITSNIEIDININSKNDKQSKNIHSSSSNYKSSNYKVVEVGDTIIIININTNEKEKYTIMPTYRTAKPIGIYRGKKNFGVIKSKPILITDNDVDAGEIISESPFAKALLGKKENEIVILKDENGKECEYKILSIIRKSHEYAYDSFKFFNAMKQPCI